MHPVSIGLIARTAIFKSEMARLESEADFQVIKRAEALSNEAIDTLKVLMRKAKAESLRKSCADSILDRAGYGKVEKKAIVSVSGEDVIRELNRRRRELAGASNTQPDLGSAGQFTG
jgi:inhibitor of KinA sporulation pathway (predicted exonuclease)